MSRYRRGSGRRPDKYISRIDSETKKGIGALGLAVLLEQSVYRVRADELV